MAWTLPTGTGSGPSVPAASVDSEVVLFDGTTGAALKRASATGIAKVTAGVLSAAVAGTDYQGGDATLTAWAAVGAQGLPYFSATDTVTTLALAADKGIYATSTGALATYDLSPFARTVLDDPTAAAARTTLGVVPGVDLQQYSAVLAGYATLGNPPSPWHTIGWFNGALAWMVFVPANMRREQIGADPEGGTTTNSSGGLSITESTGTVKADSGANALGHGIVYGPTTASGSAGHVGSGSLLPFRRDNGIFVTYSFWVTNKTGTRWMMLVTSSLPSTRIASDDVTADEFGLRWVDGTDGTTFRVTRNANSGASTLVDTGVTFAVNTRYSVSIYTIDASTMGVEIIAYTTAHTGTITRFSYSSTLPTATSSLYWLLGCRSTAGDAAARLWTFLDVVAAS